MGEHSSPLQNEFAYYLIRLSDGRLTENNHRIGVKLWQNYKFNGYSCRGELCSPAGLWLNHKFDGGFI